MTNYFSRRWFGAFAMVGPLLAGCGAAHEIFGPRLRVLGSVQDGGLPHVACWCGNCQQARSQSHHRRWVASLALVLPRAGGGNGVYLIDATPDVGRQLDMLRDLHETPADQVDRAPVDGVFLTHAHIGHYLGLAYFGFEAVNAKGLPVFCTPRMGEFLSGSGPWSQLVRHGNITMNETPANGSVKLAFAGDSGPGEVSITPLRVPHRDEYSDTVAFLFRRTGQPAPPAVLYVPDTEPWDVWEPTLPRLIEEQHVRTLVVDGTFFSADELPGREVASIGHPLMKDTMDLLEPLVREGRVEVIFTHLNHSNPALDAGSAASAEIRRRGFRVAREGEEIGIR